MKSQYGIDQHSAALLVEYDSGVMDYGYSLIPGSWSDVVGWRDELASAVEALRVFHAGEPYETDEAWEDAREAAGDVLSNDGYISIGPDEVCVQHVTGYAIYLRPLGFVEVERES